MVEWLPYGREATPPSATKVGNGRDMDSRFDLHESV